jgi:hypothetical protein
LGRRNREAFVSSRATPRINPFCQTPLLKKAVRRDRCVCTDGFFEQGFTACSGIDLNHTTTE